MNRLQMNRFPLLKQLWVYMNHGFKVLRNDENNKSYKFNVSAFVFLDRFWSVLPTAMSKGLDVHGRSHINMNKNRLKANFDISIKMVQSTQRQWIFPLAFDIAVRKLSKKNFMINN